LGLLKRHIVLKTAPRWRWLGATAKLHKVTNMVDVHNSKVTNCFPPYQQLI